MGFKQTLTKIQYVLPKNAISWCMGKLASIQTPWFKNLSIYCFTKLYPINLSLAIKENPYDYLSFNDFFIRKLKPNLRPIDQNPLVIVSPVDGMLMEIGEIHQQQLLQAKNYYFTLQSLLGGDAKFSRYFENGLFATLYLAPYHYHRVHMPISGRLMQTKFIPGKLFSVNKASASGISELYSKNERLICLFDTAVGQVAIILVGALIVGSIQTVWRQHPYANTEIVDENFSDQSLILQKGEELGFFKMGSTVILLFPKNKIKWSMTSNQGEVVVDEVIMGEAIGNIQ